MEADDEDLSLAFALLLFTDFFNSFPTFFAGCCFAVVDLRFDPAAVEVLVAAPRLFFCLFLLVLLVFVDFFSLSSLSPGRSGEARTPNFDPSGGGTIFDSGNEEVALRRPFIDDDDNGVPGDEAVVDDASKKMKLGRRGGEELLVVERL